MFSLVTSSRGLCKTLAKRFSGEAIPKPVEKWDLLSAVSLERLPVITRDFNDVEKRMSGLLEDIELQNSYKSDFEIKLENDKRRAKDLKEGRLELDPDSAPQQIGQDLLDIYQEELKSFKFAPRKGTDKEENDSHSLRRALDRHLLLLIEEKIGHDKMWVLPQGKWQEGETLRETAERVLTEKCGTDIMVRFMGNAPFGFYKYKYPNSLNSEVIGAKIFFFKAQLLKGNVQLTGKTCTDFFWATRLQMEKMPKEYVKTIRPFLIDENY